ncbi:BEACH domain-containing protein A2 [Nymphaea thermarum]|nr:BEACH domain-containing protein A2 [Nymphaea thermarum]
MAQATGGIDGPGDPVPSRSGGSLIGDVDGAIGRGVLPVEEGVEDGEVNAGLKDLVGEILRHAGFVTFVFFSFSFSLSNSDSPASCLASRRRSVSDRSFSACAPTLLGCFTVLLLRLCSALLLPCVSVLSAARSNSKAAHPAPKVEGIVMHVMKVLANQPSAALSLVEDDSLQLLFQMVANGSLTVFSRFRLRFTSFRSIQLHRHAMQAEVLNRMLKIFSSHVDNYKICQQLRVIPLFVLNMAEFPALLQEKILKILEYAVTVVNYVPEQELLSLCCLLQQPIETELKCSILSFFVKLLSFDQQYKKVLREVGLLELLLDDIKQHKYLCGVEHQNANFSVEQNVPFSRSFTIRKDDSDAILSSPRIGAPAAGKFRVFEDEGTITVAWDCNHLKLLNGPRHLHMYLDNVNTLTYIN